MTATTGTVVNPTTITFTSPVAGVQADTLSNVTLLFPTNATTALGSNLLTFRTPTVTASSLANVPSEIPTVITITGTGFAGSTPTVRFASAGTPFSGGTSSTIDATGVTLVNPTTITCTPFSLGTQPSLTVLGTIVNPTTITFTSPISGIQADLNADVTLTFPTNAAVTAAAALLIKTPKVTSSAPATVDSENPTLITITGSGFAGATPTVRFASAGTPFSGGTSSTIDATGVTIVNPTTITCTTPRAGVNVNAPSTIQVLLTGGLNPISAGNIITFNAPTVTSCAPLLIDSSVATLVTVTGTGFYAPGTVTMRFTAATGTPFAGSATLDVTGATVVNPTTVTATTSVLALTNNAACSVTIIFSSGATPTSGPGCTTFEVPAGEISGYKFQDLNANGVDDGEPRLAGVTIRLNGGTPMVTDASGEYQFTNLGPGFYTVTEDPPAGSFQTAGGATFSPLGSGDVVTPTEDQGLAFGNSPIVALSPDNTPPVPGGSNAPNVGSSELGDMSYTFTVTYSDNSAVDAGTIAASNVTVTGPGGTVAMGTTTDPNGSPLTATYTFTPPGGSWDPGDNGAYTVALVGTQVGDDGAPQLFASAGTITTFNVFVTEPTVLSFSAGDVSGANLGEMSYDFTITYTDTDAVDVSSIGVNDVSVTGPGGPLTVTNAFEITGLDGAPKTATYTVTPPGGSWDDTDNFAYSIAVVGSQVDNVAGVSVAATPVTTFNVAITPPPDPALSPPTFQAPHSNPLTADTNVNDVTWLIQFSEDVTGVNPTGADFDLNFIPTGAVSLTDAGDSDDSTYLLTVSTVPEGTLQIDQIAAGNLILDASLISPVQARQGSNELHRYKVDRTAPTPVITSTESPGPTNAALIPITVDFGEEVVGMDQPDLSVTNGTVSTFTTTDLQTYTFDITPLANGLITVDIAGAAAADPAGNDSNAAAQFSITSAILNVAITRVDPTPTTATTVDFDVVFSEPAVNVDPPDFVVVTTGSASGDTPVAVAGAGAAYVVTVNNVSRHGTLGLDLALGTDIQNGGGTAVTQIPTVDEVYDVINDSHGILSLPARTPGNVTAVVSGSNLIVTGDSGDNGISISSHASGDVVVAGVGGTTINSAAEIIAFSGVGGMLPGGLTVNSSAGRDLISIADLTVTGNALLLGGDDVDAIDVINTNSNGTLVAFEDGGDGFIDISGGTVTGIGQIFAGEGNNGVTVANANFLNALLFNAGTGIDQITLNTVSVTGGTQIDPGTGNDTISLTSTDHLSTLFISTDSGNDTVTGNDVDVTSTTFLSTGDGNDIVDFDDLHAMSVAVLIAGANNDAVRFLNSTFDGVANIPITAGNNVVDVQGTTFNGTTYIQATGGALGLRIKNNTFNSLAVFVGGPGATDVLMDNGTSSFSTAPIVSGFEDLSNTHIDTSFANLLGLVFP